MALLRSTLPDAAADAEVVGSASRSVVIRRDGHPGPRRSFRAWVAVGSPALATCYREPSGLGPRLCVARSASPEPHRVQPPCRSSGRRAAERFPATKHQDSGRPAPVSATAWLPVDFGWTGERSCWAVAAGYGRRRCYYEGSTVRR